MSAETSREDPRHIFLEPECCADPSVGRCWAAHNEWPLDDCDVQAEATQYVRADLVAVLERERDAATARAEAAERERGALQDRLEMRHAWKIGGDGKPIRIAVEPGSIPDGIACRDETIRQLDAGVAAMKEQRDAATARAEAAELGRATSDAALERLTAALEQTQVWAHSRGQRVEVLEARNRDVTVQRDAATAERDRMREALEIVAGYRQCMDNLMSNVDVARVALTSAKEPSA